jgi:hypothetical protein
MKTFDQTLEVLTIDLKEMMGFELAPNGKMWLAIKAFVKFLEDQGVEYIEDVTLEQVGTYRLRLRYSAYSEEEENRYISAALALLCAAANQYWIKPDICQFLIDISQKDFFPKPVGCDTLN